AALEPRVGARTRQPRPARRNGRDGCRDGRRDGRSRRASRRGRRVRAVRRAGRAVNYRARLGADAHHHLVRSRDLDGSASSPGVLSVGRTRGSEDAHGGDLRVAFIELWNGDICDLEVDAIVNPANPSLWMATGVGGAIKRAGGDAIEFAAVRQGPVDLGEAIVTPAGILAARLLIHAVSLDRDRRTSGPVIEKAVRSAMARARENNV